MLVNPILPAVLSLLASVIVTVNAQSPSLSLIPETTTTDLEGPTEVPRNCLLECLSAAATDFLCDVNDDICLCTSPGLAESALACASTSCTPRDVETIQEAFQQGCGQLIDTGIASVTGVPTPRPSTTSGTGSPNTDSGSGAGSGQQGSGNNASPNMQSSVLALGLSAFGALVGGVLVL
ncbi:hypothetical protein AX16_010764 [Volvariella volvacea WC 439]|nr:hypothetical protein AX16_010764 [Volvariella volvacea WC 439]